MEEVKIQLIFEGWERDGQVEVQERVFQVERDFV